MPLLIIHFLGLIGSTDWSCEEESYQSSKSLLSCVWWSRSHVWHGVWYALNTSFFCPRPLDTSFFHVFLDLPLFFPCMREAKNNSWIRLDFRDLAKTLTIFRRSLRKSMLSLIGLRTFQSAFVYRGILSLCFIFYSCAFVEVKVCS